jgi:hypothetical protein
MKVLAILVVPAVIVLGLAFAETQILSSPPSRAHATGIVWGGRTFVSRAQFSHWLRARHVRYRAWARRHPARSGIKPRRHVQRATRPTRAPHADHRSGWPLGTVGGAAAVLAVLSALVVVSRRRLRYASVASPRGRLRGVRRRRDVLERHLAGALFATVTSFRSAAFVARRRREELAWYALAVLLAIGTAFVLANQT